eukprot:6003659-Amphidinium_carterae.1
MSQLKAQLYMVVGVARWAVTLMIRRRYGFDESHGWIRSIGGRLWGLSVLAMVVAVEWPNC